MKRLDVRRPVVSAMLVCACLLSSRCLAGITICPISGPLSLGPQAHSNPTWSPDGSKIAFSYGNGYTGQGNPDGKYIVTMTASGQAIRGPANPLVNDVGWDDVYPDWSPDGNRIVYTKSRVGPSEVRKVAATGGATDPITGTATDPHGGDSNWHPRLAKWSPDGSKIAYLGGDWWNIPNPEPYHIWLTDADGSTHTDLTPSIPSYGIRGLSWSPNGSEIVFTQGGLSGLFLLDVSTQGVTALPSSLFPDAVVWASENSILFDAAGGIYEYQIDTTMVTQLTYGSDHLGDWHSTAGLVFERGGRIYTAAPIPAPGAILLGSIGVGFVGWLRRRRAL